MLLLFIDVIKGIVGIQNNKINVDLVRIDTLFVPFLFANGEINASHFLLCVNVQHLLCTVVLGGLFLVLIIAGLVNDTVGSEELAHILGHKVHGLDLGSLLC